MSIKKTNTSKKKTTERPSVVIRENIERINTILKTSNEGFWLVDNNLITIDINPRMCEILGLPKNKIIGKQIYDFVDSKNEKIFSSEVEKRKRGRKSTYEIELQRPDGTNIYCLFNATPFFSSSGKKIGAFAMVTDISSRREAEESLRRSERRYRGLVENAPTGILYVDPDGNILEINPKMLEILGSPSASKSQAINMFIYTPLVESGISAAFMACIASGKPASHEHPYTSKWGKSLYLKYHLNPVFNDDRKIEGVLANVVDISESKQAEEKLIATHEIYREVIVNAQGVPYRLDFENGKYEFFGEDLEKLLGISGGSLTYEKLDKMTKEVIITDPDMPPQTTKYGEAFRKGNIKQFRMDIKVHTKNKEMRWLSDCSVPVKDKNSDKVIGCMGIMQDITERKHIEMALRDSEQRYRALFESANDAIFLMRDNIFVECNKKTLEIFGCTTEQIVNQPPYKFSPDFQVDGRSSEEKAIEKISAAFKGKPQFFEWLHCRYDRTAFFAEVSLNRIEISGQPHLLAVVRDITERKKAEQTLQQSEEKYRALFDQARNAIFLEDKQQNILDVNRAAMELFGYTLEEFLSMKTSDLHSGKENLQIYTNHDHTYDHPLEMQAIRKDGTIFSIEISIASLYTHRETLFLSIVLDITEREKLERQLQQSQKMEAIGRLAGGVAHDFNNLLTVIRGYSELVLTHLNEIDPIYHRIKQIDRASERAEALTRQLLAFSRRQIMQIKIMNLNDVIGDMENLLRRLISEDIELITDLEKKLGHIKADPTQIEQVIMNLAVNACDAMPDGGKLSIETKTVHFDKNYRKKHPEVVPGHFILLAISDTGDGIDKETQAHIFEPFFTTKSEGEGTGLGLATVYGTVKQSGGYIWVYSEIGTGTTFKVYLPCVDQALAVGDISKKTAGDLAGSETILLVEDEIDVRTLVKETLEMMKYKVLEAGNGREALKIAKSQKGEIQMVLTDVVMPHMSGNVLVENLLKLRPGIKPLYMSGYTENAIVHKGVLKPGTQFLQKPFTPHTLMQKVREVLDT